MHKRTTRRWKAAFRPQLEILEERRCPSFTIGVRNHNLTIMGNSADNFVQLNSFAPHKVAVTLDHGQPKIYSNVNAVVVRTGAGNDTVEAKGRQLGLLDSTYDTGKGDDRVAIFLQQNYRPGERSHFVRVMTGDGADSVVAKLHNSGQLAATFDGGGGENQVAIDMENSGRLTFMMQTGNEADRVDAKLKNSGAATLMLNVGNGANTLALKVENQGRCDADVTTGDDGDALTLTFNGQNSIDSRMTAHTGGDNDAVMLKVLECNIVLDTGTGDDTVSYKPQPNGLKEATAVITTGDGNDVIDYQMYSQFGPNLSIDSGRGEDTVNYQEFVAHQLGTVAIQTGEDADTVNAELIGYSPTFMMDLGNGPDRGYVSVALPPVGQPGGEGGLGAPGANPGPWAMVAINAGPGWDRIETHLPESPQNVQVLVDLGAGPNFFYGDFVPNEGPAFESAPTFDLTVNGGADDDYSSWRVYTPLDVASAQGVLHTALNVNLIGGAGRDTLMADYTGVTVNAAQQVSLHGDGDDDSIMFVGADVAIDGTLSLDLSGTGGADNIRVLVPTLTVGSGGAFRAHAVGGAENDVLLGQFSPNVQIGGVIDAVFEGVEGEDELIGLLLPVDAQRGSLGELHFQLLGQAGNDRLDFSAGAAIVDYYQTADLFADGGDDFDSCLASSAVHVVNCEP